MYNVRLVASVRTITVTPLSFSNFEMAVNCDCCIEVVYMQFQYQLIDIQLKLMLLEALLRSFYLLLK